MGVDSEKVPDATLACWCCGSHRKSSWDATGNVNPNASTSEGRDPAAHVLEQKRWVFAKQTMVMLAVFLLQLSEFEAR